MDKATERHDAVRNRQLKTATRQVWFAICLMIAIGLLVLVYQHAGSLQLYRKLTIAGALILLVLRFFLRRSKAKRSRAAEPDPLSRLNLQ